MAHIIVTKGLDIPVDGSPEETSMISSISADLYALDIPRGYSFKLSVQEGVKVQAGQLLAQEKRSGLCIVAPVPATITAIVRGEKRKLEKIVFTPEKVDHHLGPNLYLLALKKEALLSELNSSGFLLRPKVRPFNQAVNPQILPRTIFVRAVETAPFTPTAESQIDSREEEFQVGLTLLSHLAPVHIVSRPNSAVIELCNDLPVNLHTVSGPHPAANPSLHIEKIDPIQSTTDCVWTLSALDVLTLGSYCMKGQFWIDQIIALTGSALKSGLRRYVRAYPGVALSALLADNPFTQQCRLISGDPLTGQALSPDGFLQRDHTVFCAIPEGSKKRGFLSFLKSSSETFTATNTYIPAHKKAPFTTRQHGERRPFIDGSVYERVMPFTVLPMPMVKALLAEDMDKAIEYGLLEIVPEDFALADFVCISKVGMMRIVEKGQNRCRHDIG